MFAEASKKSRSSVCKLHFYNDKGIVVDTLSGFKVNNSLVTAEEAFFIKKAVSVTITFCGDTYQSILASLEIPYKEFVSNFGIGLRGNEEGYAVFNIDLPEFEHVPSLAFDESSEIPLGHELLFLGYQEGLPCQTMKKVFVSSSFKNAFGRMTLVLDGNFGYGNSGGPIIDPHTGKVIGIVNRRITASAKYFERLINTVNENIKMLKKIEGRFSIDDVDPIQVLVVNQNQLKLLAKNIYLHSNSAQAFAILPEPLIGYFQRSEEDVSVKQKIKITVLEEM
ncbi:MAG TPA: serine protease [Williamwhitmania sp.]|nr:serine protease [Williamwhitmania sp.]